MTDKGEINDPKDKIFTKEVIEEKKNMDQTTKLQKHFKKSHKRQTETIIKRDMSIVPTCINLQPEKKARLESPISTVLQSSANNTVQSFLSFSPRTQGMISDPCTSKNCVPLHNNKPSISTKDDMVYTPGENKNLDKNFVNLDQTHSAQENTDFDDDETSSTSTSSNEKYEDHLSDAENSEGVIRALSATITGKGTFIILGYYVFTLKKTHIGVGTYVGCFYRKIDNYTIPNIQYLFNCFMTV